MSPMRFIFSGNLQHTLHYCAVPYTTLLLIMHYSIIIEILSVGMQVYQVADLMHVPTVHIELSHTFTLCDLLLLPLV